MEIAERGFEEDQTDVADVAAAGDFERPRKIIHFDMDAFASVEQRDDYRPARPSRCRRWLPRARRRGGGEL